MRKPIKWTLIGFSIFVAVVTIAVIIIFVGLFVSAGVSAIKEVSTPETKTLTAVEGPQELITGQEFIYDGKKIALTKYEFTPTNISDNQLWVYLYVENIDDVPHYHTYDTDFVIYHKGREAKPLFGSPVSEEGRKMYDFGDYDKLYPGEVCEGWINSYISTDWKAEDIEIHFKPGFGSFTPCIWKLEKLLKEVSSEAKEEIVIPTELEAREKIEEGICELYILSSDREFIRQVANWLPASWKVGMLVVRDDNPTRWAEEPEMHYYLMVTSQGGVLYVTWGVQNIYYHKSWTEIEEDIVRGYPPGTTDWAGGSFIIGEVWRKDPLWQKEELWGKDTFFLEEFWDYIYGASK